MNENVFVMDHPLIQHKLSILRDEKTGSKQFRELISEIAMLMCYESTRDLPLREVETKTPITVAKTKVLAGRKMAFVPILRAGLGMVATARTSRSRFCGALPVCRERKNPRSFGPGISGFRGGAERDAPKKKIARRGSVSGKGVSTG